MSLDNSTLPDDDTPPKDAAVALLQLRDALDHLTWHWENRTMPKVAAHDAKRARDLRVYLQTIRNLVLELDTLPATASPQDIKAVVHHASLNALLAQNSKPSNQ